MTVWEVAHKPSYDADFLNLDKQHQQRAIQAVRDLEQDPTQPRGNTIKKMVGYENVYRYRLGAYRLIYAAKGEARTVALLASGPRAAPQLYVTHDRPLPSPFLAGLGDANWERVGAGVLDG